MAKKSKFCNEFFEWQLRERKKSIEMIFNGTMPNFLVHSPVMATYGSSGMNLSCKGVGLVIKEGLMEKFVDKNKDIIKNSLVGGWKETLNNRLERLLAIYNKPEYLDKRSLCGIEIYGTTTYHNVLNNKECLLMFNSVDGKIISYQLNCSVEIFDTQSLFYRYVKSMHDLFHTPSRKGYYCAYKFVIKEVYDKSPSGCGKRLF